MIHGEGRVWAETNCYVDVLIELLHGLDCDPVAGLAFTLGIDYEGDQWTFFKFPHEDLYELYGMEVQEFNPWRSLVGHVEKQIEQGRPVLVEMDSYFLPDTVGTAYKQQHEKSTIAVNAIDIEKRTLGYFHGQSYYQLEGQDFTDIFQLEGLVHERMLPPYIEYVKLQDAGSRLSDNELFAVSLELLKKHLKLRPKQNPFIKFKNAFGDDFEWLLTQDMDAFHQYSFATLRQYGACFELLETYLRWLQNRGANDLNLAIDAFSEISNSAKVFQFQLARSVSRKKGIDMSPVDGMAENWESAMSSLVANYA